RDRIARDIAARKNPLLVDLDDSLPTLEELRTRLERRATGLGPLEGGRLTTPDGQVATVVVIPPGGLFRERVGETLASAIRRTIAELHPERYGQLEIGFSGDVESTLEERTALEHDLAWASALCFLLISVAV